MDFYRQIAEMCPQKKNVVFTVISGQKEREKLILSDGEICCQTGEGHFLENRKEVLANFRGTGIINLEGREIFYEQFTGQQHLVICGAGHVSKALISITKMLDFEITVIDDRPSFASLAKQAGADHVICESFTKALTQIAGGLDTYFVVVTRGHRFDMDCLSVILKKRYVYLGMMGSRRRTRMVRNHLMETGFSEEQVDGIHMPIGLSIGAQTPEEIAVSIVAELIQTRSSNRWSYGYPEELLDPYLALDFSAYTAEQCPVFATIIEKKGSAPRPVGSKMIFLPDGSGIGTIGGGCAESDVRLAARRMYLHPEMMQNVVTADMTADVAAEEGMVCGGVCRVLLEKTGF